MIDAVGVGHRSLERDDLGKALAERRGHGGIAPDRQQRFRQPPQRRAEMDIAGEHDVRGAQPRRRRDDALADAGRIDADDRRVLEDPRPCPPRQRGKAVDIFAAVDLERLRIIHAVEIAIGPELLAHAIDLPALHFGLEILAKHLQPADQLIADIDIGDFERALARARCPASVPRSRWRGQIRRLPWTTTRVRGRLRSRCARSVRRSEGRSPASPCRADGRMRSSRHAGLRARRRWRPAAPPPARPSGRQARRRPRRYRHPDRTTAARARAACGIGSVGRACGSLAHIVFLRTLGTCHLVLSVSLYINPRPETEFEIAPCAV